ncbi:AAA family ATPase [Kribbella sp. NPDC026611]|uniref:helix-turn-helix transcriptional regulator n=1 Tax=Kribbella sp. NPDC026611 TaxID=3154911 RepID=UPI0033C68A8A
MSIVSPVFVARGPETAAIEAAYAQAVRREPATVLVSGEAGIGKSRLVGTATAGLPGDPLVLTGGCLELGSDETPYVPFAGIFRRLVDHLGRDRVHELLPLDRSAIAAWLPGFAPPDIPFGRTRLFEELLLLIGEVARDRPVVLVVEDLQWADASSRELFVYLTRNLTSLPVLLIGTIRSGTLPETHPNRRIIAELGRRADVTELRLAALDVAAVADLVAAIEGSRPDPVRVREIHHRSSGNPLFVEALSTSGTTMPDTLRAMLRHRVSELPQTAQEVLAIVAVASTDVAEDLLCAVVGRAEIDVRNDLRRLIAHDQIVVRDLRFGLRHDLIRQVVYDELLPGERREYHTRWAEQLGNDPEAAGVVAAHWAAAGRPELALPAAWGSAQEAGRRYAYDEQLHSLERVLDLWDSADLGVDRVTVHEQAALAAFSAGRSADGLRHATAALDGLDDANRRARLLSLRGRTQNRIDARGDTDIEAALALVPPGRDDALRAGILSDLAFVRLVAEQPERVSDVVAEALEIAERLDDDALRAPALLAEGFCLAAGGEVDQAQQQYAASRRAAERAGDRETLLTAYQWEAASLGFAGRYADSLHIAAQGYQLAQRSGLERTRGAMLANNCARMLARLGRWDEAEQLMEGTLASDPPPYYAAGMWEVIASIAVQRGDLDRYDEVAARRAKYLKEYPGAVAVQLDADLTAITRFLAGGDLDRADELVGARLADPVELNGNTSMWLWLAVHGAQVVRARIAAAPRDRNVVAAAAERMAELSAIMERFRQDSPEGTVLQLMFDALSGPGDLPAWDRVAAAWRDAGNPYQLASALICGAESALASSNQYGARLRLNEAHELATRLGAKGLVRRIEQLTARVHLDDAPVAVDNDFGLTRRELDVLAALTRGLSNADIAAELFISTNTVATHVARILTKLGVSSRTQAATTAHRTGLITP